MSASETELARPLAEIGQVLSQAGLQTLLLPAGEANPETLLLGLGQDYRQRDQIVHLLHLNAWHRQQGLQAAASPCIYALVFELPFKCRDESRDFAAEAALLLNAVNRLLPAGQFVLQTDGRMHLRYHWFLNAPDWTLAPLAHWLNMSAFYLNQLLEPLEAVCQGESDAAGALARFEKQLAGLAHEA